ncbi:MAG: hypothetical protein IT423_00935 [Pirellulaceae bacterium]|nr:hypothetical protein [Pirellulaceae bacterium]
MSMIIRMSQKLNAKVKAGKPADLPLAEDPLLDWSTELFNSGRHPYILISNTKSLYSRIISGNEVTSSKQLLSHVHQALLDQLSRDGLTAAVAKLTSIDMAEAQIAKSLNGEVIRSMNELILTANVVLSLRESRLAESSTELNGTLLTILSTTKRGFGKPKDVMAEMCQQA